jgi:hypothetical protein
MSSSSVSLFCTQSIRFEPLVDRPFGLPQLITDNSIQAIITTSKQNIAVGSFERFVRDYLNIC